jgi:hypothetical protein
LKNFLNAEIFGPGGPTKEWRSKFRTALLLCLHGLTLHGLTELCACAELMGTTARAGMDNKCILWHFGNRFRVLSLFSVSDLYVLVRICMYLVVFACIWSYFIVFASIKSIVCARLQLVALLAGLSVLACNLQLVALLAGLSVLACNL